jgi:preprotein translocase subunit YajC
MLFSSAYAQAAAGAVGGFDLGTIGSMLPVVLIVVVMYFLMIRPQQKKMKEHRALIAGVRRGDRVVTGGGIIGQITKVINDGEVQLEIADGVRVRVVRSTITEVLSKTGSADAKSDAGETAAAADKDKKDR